MTADCGSYFWRVGHNACYAARLALESCHTWIRQHTRLGSLAAGQEYCGVFGLLPSTCAALPFDPYRAYAPLHIKPPSPPPAPVSPASVALPCVATVYASGTFAVSAPRETYFEGRWAFPPSHANTASALQVTGGRGCVARLWEYGNFTGWSATFPAGVYPLLDFLQFASNNAAGGVEVGQLPRMPPREPRCRAGWYAVASGRRCGPAAPPSFHSPSPPRSSRARRGED